MTEYRIDVEHLPAGKAAFRCNGAEASDLRKLARELTEAGQPDGPVRGGRVGRVDWIAPSLHALAATTLAEGDKGFVRGIYEPYPPRELHPALQDAVSRQAVARKNRVSGPSGSPAQESVDKAAGGLPSGDLVSCETKKGTT